jgi:hypothetical protein
VSLITQKIELPATYSVTPEATQSRGEMVRKAQSITAVTTAEEQSLASQIGSELQTWIKQVEEMRLALTRPFDDAKARLMMLERDHTAPLKIEKERLGRLVTDFQRVENERVAREEAARQAEYQRLEKERLEALAKAERSRKEETQLAAEQRAYHAEQAQDALVRQIAPKVSKARNAATRKDLKFTVLDARKVYASKPELCSVEVKASAVKAVVFPREDATELNPDTETVPGLALWWQTDTSFRGVR